jgi:site-specific DNA-methyltransferase (adenine-specific)
LEEAFAAMAGFVPYRWTACYLTRKSGYVSHDRRVLAHWKPLVIYGGDKQSERFCDVIESTENDTGGKERHPWGQSFSDFVEIIERLTRRGDTIVDPFCGGGTTLLAARACGRHGIGFEIDAAVAAKTQELLRRAFEDVGA